MPGATAQIAAPGAGDQYLVHNPQITLWKNVWRRYTNFALEQIKQTWTGDSDFGKKCTVVLSKSGDLVSDCWLEIKLPSLDTINHISGEQKLPWNPVISKARATSQSSIRVESYGCDVTDYVLSVRSDNSPVSSVSLHGVAAVTMALSSNVSTVTLVPLSGNTANVTATVSGNVTATIANAALTSNVAYGVSVDGSASYKNHIVAWQTTTTVADPVFTVANVDPTVPTYRAKVLANVSAASTVSGEQIVMKAKWCNEIGYALLEAVEWQLGGSRIDRHTPEHWSIWDQLTESEEKRAGYSAMIGRYDTYDINYDAMSSDAARTLYVPLRFTFNTNPGSALPLVALQFHDAQLNFEFRAFRDLVRTNVPGASFASAPVLDATLYVTYAFLSQDERMKFSQMPHEYLIEQVQAQSEVVPDAGSVSGTLTRKFTLSMSHPVKELIWVFQAASTYASDTVSGNDYFNYDIPGRETEEIFVTAKLQMNGHDRFTERPAGFFRLAQPWTHHSRVPAKKVHVYSFALHPEATNPSGAANFSRVAQPQLYVQFNENTPAGRLRIHAVSYNVLRIANGFSGLVFTN